MPTVESAVQAHYGQSNHLERIEQRLKAAGVDPLRPTMQDLNLFDQLHGMESSPRKHTPTVPGFAPGCTYSTLVVGLVARPAIWPQFAAVALRPSISPRSSSKLHAFLLNVVDCR